MIGPYLQVVGALADKVMTNAHADRMMEYMNEYNHPKNQIARMHGAGLSPWSYQGEGNTSAQPVFNPSGSLGEALGQASSNSIAEHQVKIQEKLAESQSKQNESQARVNESMANTNNVLLKYLDEKEQANIRNIVASAAESEKRTSRYDEQVDQNIASQKSQEYLNYVNSDKVVADTNRINQMLSYEIKEAASRIKLNEQQVATLKTQANLNDRQIAQLGELISKTRNEASEIGERAWFEKYKNQIVRATGVRPGSAPWVVVSDFVAKVLSDARSGRVQMNGAGSW